MAYKSSVQNDSSIKRGRRARALFLILATYVFLQIGWWANSLLRSAERLFEAQTRYTATAQAVLEAQKEWDKTMLMVTAEGTLFTILFVFGLGWIWRVISADNHKLARERNFLLAVTHELKTPIASIRLAIDTLERLKLDGNERREMMEVARAGTVRLERRVDDILQATRLNLPDEFVSTPFNILEAVEETILNFQTLNSPAVINLNVLGAEDILVEGDEEMWRLCWTNILENAFKYGPEMGPVEVELLVSSKSVTFSCIDHGSGIDEGDRAKVFEAFYRLNRDKRVEGTGLGLHLVYRIVKMHGASICIKSSPGGGATIEIIWPV